MRRTRVKAPASTSVDESLRPTKGHAMVVHILVTPHLSTKVVELKIDNTVVVAYDDLEFLCSMLFFGFKRAAGVLELLEESSRPSR